MSKTLYNEIVIHWGEKIRVHRNPLSDYHEDLTKQNVLYQLYGDSHLYGREVLLYIGITRDGGSLARTIKDRLQEHVKSVFGFVNNIYIIVGTIDDVKRLEEAEAILIASHKPSFNKEYIHDLPDYAKQEKIIIINNGNHSMLKSSCTNYWWVK
jgi:hypothetical protein